MLGQIWLGQIDILIAFGLAVFLFGGNPYVRGVGSILALSRPSINRFPNLFMFFIGFAQDLGKTVAGVCFDINSELILLRTPLASILVS